MLGNIDYDRNMWEGPGKQRSDHAVFPAKVFKTKWSSGSHQKNQKGEVSKTSTTVLISDYDFIYFMWSYFLHGSLHTDYDVITNLRIFFLRLESNFTYPCIVYLEKRASLTLVIFSFKLYSDRRLYNRPSFRSWKTKQWFDCTELSINQELLLLKYFGQNNVLVLTYYKVKLLLVWCCIVSFT